MIVIADESKLVPRLGKFPLPVEVVEFGHKATAARLTARAGGGQVTSNVADDACARRTAQIFKTDSGNVIYDCRLSARSRTPPSWRAAIHAVPGVVEHGLFVGIATTLLIAGPGEVEVIEREVQR